MSRNLASTSCDFCTEEVRLVEEPRPLAPADAGVYYTAFAGLTVANAECATCKAKYLAWIRVEVDRPFFDLSFRSTFNDEPGEADKPDPELFAATAEGQAQAMLANLEASLPEPLEKLIGWKRADDLCAAARTLFQEHGIPLVAGGGMILGREVLAHLPEGCTPSLLLMRAPDDTNVIIITSLPDDPFVAGIALSDMLVHWAGAYSELADVPVKVAVARILEGFNAERANPTDAPRTLLAHRGADEPDN
jgi:hypothetical protein